MLNKTLFALLLLAALALKIVSAQEHNIRTVQHLESFEETFKQSKHEHKVIMLEMSASYCGYCKTLEAEIINPMIISGEYNHVIIKQLHLDAYNDIAMPNNKTIIPAEYARSKNVFVTPTLLFLNDKNEEVAERIIGVNSLDYFGFYVDKALQIGADKLQ